MHLQVGRHYRDRSGAVWYVQALALGPGRPGGIAGCAIDGFPFRVVLTSSQDFGIAPVQWLTPDGRWSLNRECACDLIEPVAVANA